MKQIFISTPNHAKVNLCSFDSANYSCDSPNLLNYKENRGAMSQLKIRTDGGPNPRNSRLPLPYKSPFKK
jgi:hypothetical protein